VILLACPTHKELDAALSQTRSPAVQPVVVGVGVVAAAASTAQALARHPVRGVLHLGIAGSFDLDLAPLGSLAVATAEIWPEYGLRHGNGSLTPLAFPMLPDLPTPHLPLAPEAAAAAMGLTLPSSWARGPALTVAGVSADSHRAQELHQHWGGLTESMEGFGVALAAWQAHVPFVEVRAISNQVGERGKHNWRIGPALTALGQGLAQLLEG
jgi:futalosine hydrolase